MDFQRSAKSKLKCRFTIRIEIKSNFGFKQAAEEFPESVSREVTTAKTNQVERLATNFHLDGARSLNKVTPNCSIS